MSTAPLVDVHSHFLTDTYVAAARAAGHRTACPPGRPGPRTPTWAGWRDLLATAGHSLFDNPDKDRL